MDSQLSVLDRTPSREPALFLSHSKKGSHFLWELEHHEKFMEWWLKTPYATGHSAKEHPTWTSTKRKAKFWTTFTQCAETNSGKPAMECRWCQGLLSHPQLVVNGQTTGNSTLDRHHRESCPSAAKRGHDSSPPITPSKVRATVLIMLLLLTSYIAQKDFFYFPRVYRRSLCRNDLDNDRCR
jgi:hypothetical protein